MHLLDRYVARRIIIGFAFALVAFLAVFSLIDLLQEVEKVGTGRYGLAQALRFIWQTMPSRAYELFPAAALLGAVTGLGALAAHGELIALWATGVSHARLCAMVLQVSACLTLVAVALGELVAAPLAQRAEAERSVALSGGLALSTANGLWARSGTGFVHVRDPVSQDELHDLYIYELDGRRLSAFARARVASWTDQGWRLEDVLETRFMASGLATERVAARPLREIPGLRELRLSRMPAEDLSLADLHRQVVTLGARGESTRRHAAAFWSRVAMPATAGVMLLMAVPFVLAAPRGTKLGQRIALGALAGIGFQMLAKTIAQLGLVYGLDPAACALGPPALVLMAGLWLLRRTP